MNDRPGTRRVPAGSSAESRSGATTTPPARGIPWWRRARIRAQRNRPPLTGLIGGVVFLSASLTPSLLPRDWVTQGLICGVAATIGYGLGALSGRIVRLVYPFEPAAAVKQWIWRGVIFTSFVLLSVFLVRAARWQDRLHQLMGIEEPPEWSILGVLALAATVLILLVLLGRALRHATHYITSHLQQWVPAPVAALSGAVLVAVIAVSVINDVFLRAVFGIADRSYQAVNEVIADELSPPRSPLRSGGPGSLVDWESLGRQGRQFIAGAQPVEALQRIGGRVAKEPIRVYAGVGSELDMIERVELVLEELERTGAFERKVLAIMATTGTGWVNPVAADTLEHLYRGDTALVAMQYSYLPSYLSFVIERERAAEAGRALVERVHQRWAQLDESERPTLYIYGESLGAFAGESAFRDIDDLTDRVDGAVWVGPPEFAPLRRQVVNRRDPGSPAHLPVVDEGRTVRFAARPDDLALPRGEWSRPRVAYLVHASDPIVWWTPRLIWQRPDWLVEPRGNDVLNIVRWYPFVTFWQVSADVVHARSVPPGYGHDYGATIVDAWVAVAAPEDWSEQDTTALRRLVGDDDAGHG